MTDSKKKSATDVVAADIPMPLAGGEPAATTPVPDANRGRGGRYLRDPATGERVLIERTQPCTGCKS